MMQAMNFWGARAQVALFWFALAAPACATNYFMAPADADNPGNDANNGLSSNNPWLTPNHALSCGDVITAISGVYASVDLTYNFGHVTCNAGNNVAWLRCARPFACRSTDGLNPIAVDSSYWGVEGFTSTTTQPNKPCFAATPPHARPKSNVHHIIFANNIATGCQAGGFVVFNSGNYSADYVSFVGNIAYNAAQGSSECYSGFSVFKPRAEDKSRGTHIYIAGNFAWGNIDPNPCGGGKPTDGEGVILDTLNGFNYDQQIVVSNNILVGNGGRCITVFANNGNKHARVYLKNNSCWANNVGPTTAVPQSEIQLYDAFGTSILNNIVVTRVAKNGNSTAIYAYYQLGGNPSNTLSNSDGYSASGITYGGIIASAGVVSVDPSFSLKDPPGPPSCENYTTTEACLTSLISSLRTSVSGLTTYGYQVPGEVPTLDPLYPAWLCDVSLPKALDAMGCITSRK